MQLEWKRDQNSLIPVTPFQSHIGAIRITTWAYESPWFEKFQSHIGAIRISAGAGKGTCWKTFQSHIGAIRMVFVDEGKNIAKFYFNPTLVQLESNSTKTKKIKSKNFNPTLVQLESNEPEPIEDYGDISIPHWCN